MYVPEKGIQDNCPHEEESINSEPSTIYKHKKFLRSKFEEAMSIQENSSSLNVSLSVPNQLEKVPTAVAQLPLPPNPPPPDTPPMIDNLKREIEDDENKCDPAEILTEFNQPEELKAAAPVTNTAQSEEQPSVTMCQEFSRGTCKKGLACSFAHQINLRQLPGVYNFCKDFQNAGCPLPKCKFVHATVLQQEHYFSTGYLPPYTLAHLEEFSVLQPPPPPPQSEETSAAQPTVYCNAPPPPPPTLCTPDMAVGHTARERSEPNIFGAQPGTSNSSQNPECCEIDKGMYFNTKLFSDTNTMSFEENSFNSDVLSLGQNLIKEDTTAAAQLPLPPSPPPPMIDILKHDIEDDENKCGSTESLTEFNEQKELTAASSVTTTVQSEKQPSVQMCRNYVRGLCRLGEKCKFEHEIIVPQLQGAYTFCRNFESSICPFPKCKFVHATVFEQEHYRRTGYLPLHTRAHLIEFSVLQPPPPPPQSEEASAGTSCYVVPPPPPISSTPALAVRYNVDAARERSEPDIFGAQPEASAEQPTVYCNAPPPPPPISCTPAEAIGHTARERSEPNIFGAQPGTSNSSQNPECCEIDKGMYFNTKLFSDTDAMSFEENPSSSDVSSLGQNIIKKGSTESLTEFNQEEELMAAAPVTAITAQSEEQSSVKICRNFVRRKCKKGVACIFKHEIIASQLLDVYTFCRNYQNTECSLPKCKYVHATVFEQQHFYRTGYLPTHTLAHLKESSVFAPLPPPPKSEETSAAQPTVYCNAPPPPPPILCTPPATVGCNAEAARERSEPDIPSAQPGTSISSQNPEGSEINKASSSTNDCDSAKRCNNCPSREQRERELDAEIADARRRFDEKQQQVAMIDAQCELMESLISVYNNHVNQSNQAAELANRRKHRH